MSENNYDLKPSKEAYKAVKSDVTPVSAFKELIDNALDNWMRVSQRTDDIDISIEYYEGDDEEDSKVVIRDNTGGVDEEDVRILFALGQSKKSSIEGSIGAYGIGAKKAIVNLGNKATIKSRSLHSEKGYGFTIDEDWLRDDDDWSVEKEEHDDIDKGVTEIQIENLNINWEEYSEDLAEDLSETYEKFLDGHAARERGALNIKLKEFDSDDWDDAEETMEVEAPDPIDWSFTPIDGFYPRRYENIKIESRDLDEPVYLHITVGLMRGSNSSTAGADIFCQDRKVLSAVRDERAGFGTGSGSNRLKNFSNQHHRLKFVMEFETEGDASKLPWDAQKSDIDQYNRVSQAAYNWVRRIVRPYIEAAGSYDEFPTSFLREYGRGNEFSETSGIDDPYDYSDRERVTHKPNTSMETAKEIKRQAGVSHSLEVYAPGSLDNKYIPAFEEELNRLFESDVDIESLSVVEGLPAAMETSEADENVEDMTMQARNHLRDEERMVDLPNWQQTVYNHILRDLLDDNQVMEELFGDADKDISFEDLQTVGGDSIEAEEDITGGDEGEEETSSEAESELEEEEEVSEEDRGSDFDIDETVEEMAEEVTQVSEETENEEEATEKVQDTLKSHVEEFTQPATNGSRTLQLEEEDWSELTDALGLNENASEEKVRDELLETMDVLRQLGS
jgi:hypothetical protein